MRQCEITANNSIILQKYVVYIETPSNNMLNCHISYDASVLDLKKAMVLNNQQKLFLKGIELEDQLTLSSYGIKHLSTLFVDDLRNIVGFNSSKNYYNSSYE